LFTLGVVEVALLRALPVAVGLAVVGLVVLLGLEQRGRQIQVAVAAVLMVVLEIAARLAVQALSSFATQTRLNLQLQQPARL
jgi:hypothetical protein